MQYIIPDSLYDAPSELIDEWHSIQRRAEALYLELIDCEHMKKEDARYILPQGCTTSLRICGNFQMWHDLLANRAAKKAQWEVRDIAHEILRQLNAHAPNIFKLAE